MKAGPANQLPSKPKGWKKGVYQVQKLHIKYCRCFFDTEDE